MFGWIMYDITDNKIRNKIAALCMDYGFVRFQKSVFCGITDEHTLDIIKKKITDIIRGTGENDSILVFTLCNTCMKNHFTIGKEFNRERYLIPSFIIL